MMMLYQSENVRILVIRRPDAPNMYYVGVEVLKLTNNLRLKMVEDALRLNRKNDKLMAAYQRLKI